MKVLIYSANFAPEPTGIGKYSGEMAQWLVAHGHEVRAVAAPPYYPQWRLDPDYRWPPFRRERWHGVDVWRAPLWVPGSPGGAKRVLHLLTFAISSLPLMLAQIFWRPDVVLTVAPAIVCAPAALLTARICGAHAWIHLQDLEADIAFRMNLLRGKYLKRIILRMERWILRRFDNVSSISSRMIDRLLLKGVPANRLRFFPNWVDIAHIKSGANAAKYRERLGIAEHSIVVLFSGTLGGKQGLMVVPEAAALLAHRTDILFLVCGAGLVKPQLEAACRQLPNTRFMPLRPFSELGDLLCMADIHLLPQSRNAEDLVLPSKLSGMLASGRPVIATCNPGTELDAVVSNCGLVVEPEDAAALAQAVVKLADDAALRAQLGHSGRAYAETNFERDAVLERIFGPLERGELRIPDVAT